MMEDIKIKEVLSARLKREINKFHERSPYIPDSYIAGYENAINDIFGDLFNSVLVIQEALELKRQWKKEGKLIKVDISKIKLNDENDE